LVDAATGISGFYLHGWAIAFFAIAFFVFGGSMTILFGLAIGLGSRLRRIRKLGDYPAILVAFSAVSLPALRYT
jgi:hypothetical protein